MRSENYYFGFGYGADTNGFGPQAAPRGDAAENPLQYPYTAFDGTVMDQQRAGTRVFDVNTDGVAQYDDSRLDRGHAYCCGRRRRHDHRGHEPWRRGLPADVGARAKLATLVDGPPGDRGGRS